MDIPNLILWNFVLKEFVFDEDAPLWMDSTGPLMDDASAAFFAPPLPLDDFEIPA